MVKILVFLLAVSCTFGSPTNRPKEENCDKNEEYEVIDQRQNGTENYRLNINGVVLMWAPAKSLLTAAGLLDAANFGADFEEIDFLQPAEPEIENKPTSAEPTTEGITNNAVPTSTIKPNKPKRPKLQLPTLILPFLKKRPAE